MLPKWSDWLFRRPVIWICSLAWISDVGAIFQRYYKKIQIKIIRFCLKYINFSIRIFLSNFIFFHSLETFQYKAKTLKYLNIQNKHFCLISSKSLKILWLYNLIFPKEVSIYQNYLRKKIDFFQNLPIYKLKYYL